VLETLISSRIRRALLEHILSHPTERFYLRGLAKTLDLSVSPLRRELKRLEHSGLLTAVPEGNIVFYAVDTTSPTFLQLKHASERAEAPSEARPVPGQQVIQVGVVSAPKPSLWRSPLSGPVLAGAAALGLTLVLIIAGLFYLTMTHERLVTQASRALAVSKPEVTVVVPEGSSGSGMMRGSRWQILPGGFGGFSSGAGEESY
jgi:hypothetical protein